MHHINQEFIREFNPVSALLAGAGVSGPVALSVGANEVEAVARSGDGRSVVEYVIELTRRADPTHAVKAVQVDTHQV